jgi:hypothetical protein
MGIIEFECGTCRERWRSHMISCPKCGADVVKGRMKTALEVGLVKNETKTTLLSGGGTNVSERN